MKRDRRFYWGVSLVVIILLAGCTSSTKEAVQASPVAQIAPGQISEDILARVGDHAISVSEFQERFNALSSSRREGGSVEEQKEKALERLVQATLMSLEARAEKIDREESVAKTLQDMADSILAREYYDRRVRPELSVTEDEIKNYYDSHPDEFTESAKLKARHILVGVEPDATREAWDMALKTGRDLKKEIDNVANFEKLAREKSDDSRTKQRGGALWKRGGFSSSYLTRETLPAGFPDIVFSLEEGKISEPLKGAKGYHIIKVETKRPERIQTLDQVKGTLKQKLTKQKHEELFAQTIERLKEKYKVILNTELLGSVKVEKKKRKGG